MALEQSGYAKSESEWCSQNSGIRCIKFDWIIDLKKTAESCSLLATVAAIDQRTHTIASHWYTTVVSSSDHHVVRLGRHDYAHAHAHMCEAV